MAKSMSFTIFVIGLAIGYSKAQESILNCPNGFIHHDDSCYKVHKELFNWPEAYSFCKALNSHLVKIESSEEFHFLTSRLQELKGNFQGTPGFYVGATDAMVQDEFVWADSTEKVTYLPWSPGQPDDGTGEDCLGIHIDTNGAYLYHDYICTDKLNFICERELDLGPVFG